MVIFYNSACFDLKTSKRKRWLETDKKSFYSVNFFRVQKLAGKENRSDREIKQVL
jgi:hypothetical protein